MTSDERIGADRCQQPTSASPVITVTSADSAPQDTRQLRHHQPYDLLPDLHPCGFNFETGNLIKLLNIIMHTTRANLSVLGAVSGLTVCTRGKVTHAE